MSISGIHRGCLRKYGGFVFKQWKERFLILTADGHLMVCPSVTSPPDQMVALQGGCEAIVEGREILDLPKLPSGGRRDCCFALILPQDKFMLLLSDSPDDCSQWLKMLRKVKESVASQHQSCRRHQAPPPCITDRDPVPDYLPADQDPPDPPESHRAPPPSSPDPPGSHRAPPPPSPGPTAGDARQKDKGKKSPHSRKRKEFAHSGGCLRHGTSTNARAVRAVYLLMGGAAASSAMGYLGAGAASPLEARPPDLPASTAFSDMEASGPFHHSCGQVVDSPHFHSFDFEGGDSGDFDAFDCGGFAF